MGYSDKYLWKLTNFRDKGREKEEETKGLFGEELAYLLELSGADLVDFYDKHPYEGKILKINLKRLQRKWNIYGFHFLAGLIKIKFFKLKINIEIIFFFQMRKISLRVSDQRNYMKESDSE